MAGRGTGPALRRRGLLAAALAAPVLTAGCKGFGALGTPPRQPPGVDLLTGVIAAEKVMIARYQAVLAASPALAPALGPLLAEHRAHLTHLTARLVPGAARPTPSAPASPAPPRVPAGAAAATAYLRGAEQAAAADLLRRLATAPPSLAQLLASIAASEATHAAALRRTG